MFHRSVTVLLLISTGFALGADEPPKSVDPRLTVELFAEHPQIVTPTGLDVDHRGRVFAIESNTHFPPEGYKGHPTDRVLVMSDSDNDGRADKIVVFTDGLVHSMSVLVRPLWFPVAKSDAHPAPKQSVYIATRKEIRLFHDDNGDDVADRNDLIVQLDTKGNYPHNGLAGFALDGLGWLYFGFGENLGAEFKLIGSDGITLGGRDGGNIYRCRLDGSRLNQICTGFWNPHANAFDAFGDLFSVDNDPDSRPPCRLIHVIPDGDYGYKFRNGRKGLHPFTSWNGEVPGTLPMVAGTGEAPSGILAYESDGLPDEYVGNLLATSWGDHRIDRFRLQPKGASFTSLAEPVITGGENFRPVGLATAPDGSLYCTDWVLRDYKLHGHGRIWRIRNTAARTAPVIDLAGLASIEPAKQTALIDSPRRDVRRMAAHQLKDLKAGTPRGQLELFWSGRAKAIAASDKPETDALADFTDTLPNLATGTGERPPFARGSRKAGPGLNEMLADALSPGREPRHPDGDLLLPMLAGAKFEPNGQLVKLVCSVDDPFVQSILVTVLARQFKQDHFAIYLTPGSNASVPARLAMLLAARKQNPKEDSLLRVALNDRDADVRRVAVQWAAEERLTDLRPRVEAILSSPGMTADLFLATLAALQMLDGGNPADFDKTPPENYVVPLIKDEQRPAAVRAQALRLVAPTDKVFDVPLLTALAKSDDKILRLESVRTLQGANPQVSIALLREIVADDKRDLSERAEAVVGLAGLVKSEPAGGPMRKQLAGLLTSSPQTNLQLQREALRATRGLLADDELRAAIDSLAGSLKSVTDDVVATELADQIALSYADSKLAPPASIRPLLSPRPKTSGEWLAQLNRGRDVDAAAGRRTFYHPQGAGCFKCHRIDGRGGRVGPDLSRAVGTMNRIQLIQSILEPSREIAPQFVSWTFETRDGKVVTGMIVHENEGKTVVGNSEGQTIELKTADIETRVPQRISVMPEKLADRMTLQELRDLIAFLDAQR
jgi:putative membrane-bound dehydrogenase-like protein